MCSVIFPAYLLSFLCFSLSLQVILYSEGFESSKTLARKMTQMYKLCSEQLSQQDHYDFGMRAVKSVLVMAGSEHHTHAYTDPHVHSVIEANKYSPFQACPRRTIVTLTLTQTHMHLVYLAFLHIMCFERLLW